MNTTQDTMQSQAQKDPAQLEREIAQQRRHIEEIVQALESRLSPGEVFERVLSFSKGGGREFTGNLMEAVKQNPMPAMVAAAGLAWLYSASRTPTGTTVVVTETTYDTTATDGASPGVGDRLRSAKSTIGEKAHGAADSVRSGARSAKDGIASGVHRASEGYGTMLQENPLAAGAIAVAVGALLGALIPPTRKEDEWMGEASDRAIDKVKTTARTHGDTLKQHARDLTRPQAQGSTQAQGGSASDPTTGAGLSGSGSVSGASIGGAASGPQSPRTH